MSERLCRCGCGEPLVDKAVQARYVNETHRARHAKRRQRGRDTGGYTLREWLALWGPMQRPTLPDELVKALERREAERLVLIQSMEADETLIGRTLKGRVGTSMRGQGGILPWAEHLYKPAGGRRAAA